MAYLVEGGRDARGEHDELVALREMIIRHLEAFPVPDEATRTLLQPKGMIGPVFLPATARSTVPVLNAEWDELAPHDKLRLRVGLFVRAADGSPAATGYRFETPEADAAHDHHLHHVQPIAALSGPSGRRLPGLGLGGREQEPTFPLPAQDATGLVVCLLIALYGRTAAEEMSGQLGHVLKRSIRHAVGSARPS